MIVVSCSGDKVKRLSSLAVFGMLPWVSLTFELLGVVKSFSDVFCPVEGKRRSSLCSSLTAVSCSVVKILDGISDAATRAPSDTFAGSVA
jgi:hypothetical protein